MRRGQEIVSGVKIEELKVKKKKSLKCVSLEIRPALTAENKKEKLST